jgi:hypothetical protein
MKKFYILTLTALMIGFGFGVVNSERVAPTVQAEDCQYPTRDNSGGCDNSDPCDPENIKNGGACKDEPSPIAPVAPTPQPAPVQPKCS